jgi:hypothetical protein
MRLRLRYLEALLEHTLLFFLCVFSKEGCMRALHRLFAVLVISAWKLLLFTERDSYRKTTSLKHTCQI